MTISRFLPALALCATAFGQSPIVLNDDGGWCWFQDDRALIHDGVLLFGSVASGWRDADRRGDIDVTSYALATGELATFELHDRLHLDDHDAPALLVRRDGRVIATYARHGNDDVVRTRITLAPGRYDAWSAEHQFATGGAPVTYSNLVELPGDAGGGQRILDLHRGEAWDPNVLESRDGGDSWTHLGQLLSGPGRPYLKYAGFGGDVHFLATDQHPRDFDNSVYHGILRGEDICRSDGTVIGRLGEDPPHPEELTVVWPGAPDAVGWLVDLKVDAAGSPFALLSVQKDGAGKPPKQGGHDHRYVYARPVDGAWQVREIAYAGSRLYAGEDDYTGLGALDSRDPSRVVIATNADPGTGVPLISARDGERHHEIFEGRIEAGEPVDWQPVTRDSESNNLRPLIPRGNGDGWDVVLWLRGVYRSYGSYDLEVVGRIRDLRGIPDSYRLVCEQDFQAAAAIADFRFSDPAVWQIGADGANRWLGHVEGAQYEPEFRSPLNVAVLPSPVVGSFVLDVDLMQTGRDYGHRDMCIFFGVRDPSHYYYAHLATAADDNAHHIQIVDGAARRPITTRRSDGVDWGRDLWRRVRVARDAESGSIRVWFGGLTEPVLEAVDSTFDSGLIGFGSFDDQGRIDGVRLWAPGVKEADAAEFFQSKRP